MRYYGCDILFYDEYYCLLIHEKLTFNISLISTNGKTIGTIGLDTENNYILFSYFYKCFQSYAVL